MFIIGGDIKSYHNIEQENAFITLLQTWHNRIQERTGLEAPQNVKYVYTPYTDIQEEGNVIVICKVNKTKSQPRLGYWKLSTNLTS